MPVYIRKSPMGIPPPSDKAGSSDEENSFLKDPDQLQDQLPQPFRMIDKVLNSLIDSAWEIIQYNEAIKIEEQSKKKIPNFESTGEMQLSRKVTCLAFSEDGNYIFAGFSNGIGVFCSQSNSIISVWEEEGTEITSFYVTSLGEQAHLIACVDDMGIARLFSYFSDTVILIKTINEPDDVSGRIICSKFELSKGGDFAAAVLEDSDESWLEVYRCPKDSWLQDVEIGKATLQKQQYPDSQASSATDVTVQPSSVGDIKFSSLTIVMKIKPPKSISGTSLKSPFETLHKTDDGNVIGTGQNHMISSQQLEEQELIFKAMYKNYLEKAEANTTESKSSLGNFHFLLPGGLIPSFADTKGQNGVPIALSLWWSGSHNLFKYLLVRQTKEKTDSEPRPDVVLPNAKPILCSSVSSSTGYIALGLMDGVLTIWDRLLGMYEVWLISFYFKTYSQNLRMAASPWQLLYSQTQVLLTGCSFFDPCFGNVENTPISLALPNPKIQVLAACSDGSSYIISTARSKETTLTRLTERADSTDSLPHTYAPIPLYPTLVLLITRNGKITIMNTDGKPVCCFSLPPTHILADPWHPMFLLSPHNTALFMKADLKLSLDEMSERQDVDSSLFIFRFCHFSVMESYNNSEIYSKPLKCSESWEEWTDRYFQYRLLSQTYRNEKTTTCWRQLQEHTELERQQKGAQMNAMIDKTISRGK
ncbi:WD repeat-containing protein 93 [Erpetoichthys calabaricus]|uniref:WD repeat-containing protein 93 n=1 Tax=Erpetoichthys calabaricus TaxID=27687 RepID=UPI002234B9ED|nr:WD repeat-containing protein 93 [Erpetoichthys calabaricus]